jgi:serine/threonine protein kinase
VNNQIERLPDSPNKRLSFNLEVEQVHIVEPDDVETSLSDDDRFVNVNGIVLEVDEDLGSGTHAHVCAAFGESICEGDLVAVKTMRSGVEVYNRGIHELDLEHPNVVQVYDVGRDNRKTVVMEYCDLGSLAELLYVEEAPLSWKRCVKILLDIALGMQFLHERCGLVHGDLRSANILLNSKGVVKVSDYALTLVWPGQNESCCPMTAERSPEAWRWTAPEYVHDASASDGECNSAKVDVFSFAMVMYEVIMHSKPYENYSCAPDTETRPQIDKMPAGCPAQLVNLMKQCWSTSPHERPSFTWIVESLKNQLALLQMYAQFKGVAKV